MLVHANDKYQITSDIPLSSILLQKKRESFHENNFYGDGNLSHIKLCKKSVLDIKKIDGESEIYYDSQITRKLFDFMLFCKSLLLSAR